MKYFYIFILGILLAACTKFDGVTKAGTWQVNEPATYVFNSVVGTSRKVEPPTVFIELTDKPDQIQVQGALVYLNDQNFKKISPTEIILNGKNYIFVKSPNQ